MYLCPLEALIKSGIGRKPVRGEGRGQSETLRWFRNLQKQKTLDSHWNLSPSMLVRPSMLYGRSPPWGRYLYLVIISAASGFFWSLWFNWFDLYIRPVVGILSSDLCCASGNVSWSVHMWTYSYTYIYIYIYIRWIVTQQTQNVNVTFLESCTLVASDLTLQNRFYNVLSDLCLETSNIQKHVW